MQMQKSNPRFLQTSPTAATLRQHQSMVTFDSVPPLVSIHDEIDMQSVRVFNKNQQKIQIMTPKNGQMRNDKAPQKVAKVTSPNMKRRQADNVGGKGKNLRMSPSQKRIISSQINQNNQVYTTKQRNKKPFSPTINMEEAQRQQSYAESVYLDLQEYSSIYKHESFNPYNQELDEYAQYLGVDERDKLGSLGNININLDTQESYTRNKMPKLTTIDHRQRLIPNFNILTQIPQQIQTAPIKVKKTQSYIFDDNTAQEYTKKQQAPDSYQHRNLMAASQRIKEKPDNVNQFEKEYENSHKYSGEFQQFPEQSRGTVTTRGKGMGQLEAMGLQIFNSCLSKFLGTQKVEQNMQQKKGIFTQFTPDWLIKNNTGNALRLILTKPAKFSEYQKYLTQLQIRIRKHKYNLEISSLGNRDDTKAQKVKQKSNKKEITVHYDNDKQYMAQASNQKIKSTPYSKKLVKQSQASIKSGHPNPMSYHLPSQAARSSKAKSVFSDRISTFNVFTGSNSKNKYRQYPQVISEIHSEMDVDSDDKGVRFCKDEVDVLRILQVLLFKLKNKKCNVYIKQGNNQSQANNGDDYFSNPSQKINTNNLMQLFGFGIPTATSVSRTEIAKLQFDEYLDPESQDHVGGSQMANNVQRIRQLTQKLESKQKYLYEVKTGYDYVINNYITTIANLKNGGQQHEKEPDPIDESKEGSYRQSQPITFQMSKHESFNDQDQWMGNPNAQMSQSDDDKQLNKLRHSLPDQN